MRSTTAMQAMRGARSGTAVALAAVAMLLIPSAHAEGDWTGFLAFVLAEQCAAQDPQFRTLPILETRTSLTPRWSWEAFDARPHSQCYRRRQWVPPALCESLRPLTFEGQQALAEWRRRQAKSIFRLGPVLDFENDVLGGRRSAEECPDLQPAAGVEMGPGGILMVSKICGAQDPRHQSGPFGQAVAPPPDDGNWRPAPYSWTQESASPLFQCLKKRHWLSSAFCEAVDAVPLKDTIGRIPGPELSLWIKAHAADITRYEPVFDFVNGVDADEWTGAACPDLGHDESTGELRGQAKQRH